MLLSALTRTSKLYNDQFYHRFPIQSRLLDVILHELERAYTKQPYLEVMYKTIFMLLYYGLMRIGELALGPHTLRASDVYNNNVKRKLLLLLHSSKTHGRDTAPQRIKIAATRSSGSYSNAYCPFDITHKYMAFRGGGYVTDNDKFIVLPDGQPISPQQVRKVLRQTLKAVGLDNTLYDTHSFRIGRATDLSKKGVTLEKIKRIGRWKSNAVYRYLRYA